MRRKKEPNHILSNKRKEKMQVTISFSSFHTHTHILLDKLKFKKNYNFEIWSDFNGTDDTHFVSWHVSPRPCWYRNVLLCHFYKYTHTHTNILEEVTVVTINSSMIRLVGGQ